MEAAPRYAIYFVPAAASNLYRYGSSILGYDCYSGVQAEFPGGIGDGAVNWSELSAAPRRYGFHATLKAPFFLSQSCSEQQLINALQSFAGLGHAVHKFSPTVRLLEDFFAVVPPRSEPSLDLLASACTTLFDAFRAPMSPQERARRIALGLNRSQIQNLDRWGDPYVLSEFRFHLTLTGKLPARRHKTIQTILLNAIRRLPVEREIAVDRLALLKQESPEANFRVVSEASLAPRADGRR